jgi:hypothetical protein
LCENNYPIKKIDKILEAASIPFKRIDTSVLRPIDILKYPMPRESTSIGTQLLTVSNFRLRILTDGALSFDLYDPRDRVYAYIGMANEVTHLANQNRAGGSELVKRPPSAFFSRQLTVPFPIDVSTGLFR